MLKNKLLPMVLNKVTIGLKKTKRVISLFNKGSDDIFYWFFPCRCNGKVTKEKAPLVLWLTGGPGCSSELAIFYENGPMLLSQEENADPDLIINKYAWNNDAHLLYVDQPIGTGFSKASSPDHLVTNMRQVAKTLNEVLVKFISQKHPELTKRDLYITGESYAGKYVPFLAQYLDMYRGAPDNKKYINLKGIGVGNGMVHPDNQYDQYLSYAEENGLYDQAFDDKNWKAIQTADMAECKALSKYKVKYIDTDVCNNAIMLPKTFIKDWNQYNIKTRCNGPLCYNFGAIQKLFARPDVQYDLFGKHGKEVRQFEMCSGAVNQALVLDWHSDASIGVSQLLENGYKVLIYNGEWDYACNWKGG